MSSGPYPEGVRNLRHHAKEFRSLSREQLRLEAQIRSDSKKLTEVKQDAESARQQVDKLLEEMDLKVSGNCGWGDRIAWTLAEVIEQSEQRTQPERRA